MGQEQIVETLTKTYPRWIKYKRIAHLTGMSYRSTLRCLCSLTKCEEVEFKMIYGKKFTRIFEKLYRLKKVNDITEEKKDYGKKPKTSK